MANAIAAVRRTKTVNTGITSGATAVRRTRAAILATRIAHPVAAGRLTCAGGVAVFSTRITGAVRAVVAILARRIANSVAAGQFTNTRHAVIRTVRACAVPRTGAAILPTSHFAGPVAAVRRANAA